MNYVHSAQVDNWDDAPELLKPHVLLDGGAKESFIGSGDGGCGFVGTWHIEDAEKWAQAVDGVMNVSQVRKTPFNALFILNAIVLPRQARDKHREKH